MPSSMPWRRSASKIWKCRRRRSASGAPLCRKRPNSRARDRERKTMYNFDYQRPQSVADAAKAIGGAEDGKLLAGGMTLIPTLKQRLAKPSDLVDLGRIAELKGIKREGNAIVIGAMTKHVEVATSDVVKGAIPALAHLAELIGDPQVRNRGTIGGSIANNDPAADYPAAILALNATVITNKRKIAADEFFKGMFETALEPDEIITAVSFPISERAGY